jgi:hypothetical protein
MLYSAEEKDLVFVWCEKWLEFLDLITAVIGNRLPPEENEELHYQRLRFWFVDHQSSFVPLWKAFRSSQARATNPDAPDEGGSMDLERMAKYQDNPLSYFYEPENLFQMAHHLGLQPGTDTWEPSESRISVVRPVILAIGGVMLECDHWISERTLRHYD